MKTGQISINNSILEVLCAVSEKEQQIGLMFREPPTPNMAFLYNKPRINKFWMYNTPAPLDIIFACNGKIIEICEGIPYSTAAIGSNNFSDLVIELPKGTSSKLNLKIGDNISFI